MLNRSDYPISYLLSDTSDGSGIKKTAERANVHQGQIVERVVRCNRMGISEISRRLHVSRRTLYNWFDAKELSLDIICKVGFIIGHDFSKEFPEEFANKANALSSEVMSNLQNPGDKPKDPIYYWMDRYIKLLEKFNEVLSHKEKSIL